MKGLDLLCCKHSIGIYKELICLIPHIFDTIIIFVHNLITKKIIELCLLRIYCIKVWLL